MSNFYGQYLGFGAGISGVAIVPWFGARGAWGGGQPPTVDTIDYITIASTGDATDFGNLRRAERYLGGYGGAGRGCFLGGTVPSDDTTNTIQYITLASTGDAQDFGDLTTPVYGPGGLSDGSRGVKIAGGTSSSGYNVIDYVTIATLGNALDFGDTLTATQRDPAGLSNGTYGLYAQGIHPGISDVIEKITVATTGNAVDWADLADDTKACASCGNQTRGLWLGGFTVAASDTWHDKIDYITIATQANTVDFGNLLSGAHVSNAQAVTDATYGVVGGGHTPSYINVIQYVTIASTGDAADFGDLTVARASAGAVSG